MKGCCLIWVGKENRRDPETQLCDRYFKRIGGFWSIDQRVVKPVSGRGMSVEEIQKREAERIMAAVAADDFLVVCDERGKEVGSKQLAALLDRWQAMGHKRLLLLVGGAVGLAEPLRQRAGFMLSLSRMTLPHTLARVVLLEQIYRALCIRANHPYHHED